MLILDRLGKRFGERPILSGIDLVVEAGRYIAVMGESGVGKSTLLNLIAGLDTPDMGSVHFDGVDVGSLSDDRRTALRRHRMGFVFQSFHLLPYLDATENVALALALLGVPRIERIERATRLLEAVGLSARARALPGELSGGEMQRVAIARALVHAPALVLADEPTGNLDPDTAAQTLILLKERIRATGAAGILVTHSRSAARTTDRIYVLGRDGLRPDDAAEA